MAASNPFGTIAVVLGLAALAAVLLHFQLGPIETPPALEEVVAEQAVRIRDATVARLRGETYEAPTEASGRGPDAWLQLAVTGAGLGAVALGVVALLCGERLRIAGAGAALGALALAFQVAIVLFALLILAILIAAVVERLDFLDFG